MELTFNREDLLAPLSAVGGIVERRHTLPILSHVLLRVEAPNKVRVAATDLDVEVIVGTKAQTDSKGEFTVGARKLLDICRALPEGVELTLRKDGEKIAVKAGKSRFRLLSLPAADFPTLETTSWDETIKISTGNLKRVLESTQFCMAQQDVRYYLNGLLLDFDGDHLNAVATDGHRMAIAQTDCERSAKGQRQIIVPRKAVVELARLLGSGEDMVELQISPNHLQARSAGIVFTVKLIDGRFPDYQKVIPAQQTKLLSFNRYELRETLTRVAILSNEKYRGVRLGLQSGKLQIAAHNPEQEEAEEELSIDYKGETLEIGFNVSYLIDAVNALSGDELIMGLSDANSSCTISPPKESSPRYVIMPMRL